MAESGAVPRISGSGILARLSAQGRSRADWAWIGLSVRGPLLTLATAILFDVLARHNLPVNHPFVFLLLTVVYSTYSGGLRPGGISSVVMILYAVHFLSEPRTILHYTSGNAYMLVGLALAVPATVLLVARLREAAQRARGIELSRAESERESSPRRRASDPGPSSGPRSRGLLGRLGVRDPWRRLGLRPGGR